MKTEKIAYIGTYLPRYCGIATFNNNLIKAVSGNSKNKDILSHAIVIAVNKPDAEKEIIYPEEVKFKIRQEHQRDYIDAAKYINISGAQTCIINHEFGIYGGDNGLYILSLIFRLEIPIIVIFHTVLSEPSFIQKNIVIEIGKVAQKIVVMSDKAIMLLKTVYNIDEEKIEKIEHGVPDFPGFSREKIRTNYNLSERKVLLTFGLLSRNKGIETVINALPEVVEKHPDLLFIVLGRTHPVVQKYAGEEYRNYLHLLVKKYNLENNVVFVNSFVSEEVLFEYLTACDMYVTPYLSEAQITSGTLSYAIGAGAAVISTPYWHAQELLAEGRGRLFNFQDTKHLVQILFELLDEPAKIEKLRKKAYDYGKKIRWPVIGKHYLNLVDFATAKYTLTKYKKRIIIDTALMPEFRLDHVIRLTDDTGIVQHARYGIPNLKEGYCLDDNARALLMALMAYRQNKNKDALRYIPVFLSYIQYMQTEKGSFHNFLSFSRNFLDDEGSDDSFGRTIWALCYLLLRSPSTSYREFGREIFNNSIKHFDKLTSLRGIANTIVGISYYMKAYSSDDGMLQKMRNMAKILKDAYYYNQSQDWQWFEQELTYDNAVLPLSLFHVVELTADETLKEIALKTTEFLEKVTMNKGYLSLVGCDGWYRRGGKMALFDQQATDAMLTVRLFYQAYKVSKNISYIEKMFMSYLWFLGENELRIPLYDYETCGCCDGLEKDGVNLNQGAESTLSFLISHITVLNSLEYEYEQLA